MDTAEKTEMSLEELLKHNLTHHQYENLADLLNTSPHMLTKYLNEPSRIPAGIISELASLCKLEAQSIIDAINYHK